MTAPNAFFVVSMVTIGSDGTVVVDAEGDGALGFVRSGIIFWFSVSFWLYALYVVV